MDYKIQKDVPIPKPVRGKPIKYDLPLEEMDVGDFIGVDLPKKKIDKEIKIIRNAFTRLKSSRLDTQFKVVKLEDGVGIWRTE